MFALKRPFRRFKTYKDGLFAVSGFLFCLIGLFVANMAYAEVSLTDNFESYDLGNINGQGDWYATSTGYNIVNDEHFTGTKSLYASSTLNGLGAEKLFENGLMTSGYLSFKQMIENNQSGFSSIIDLCAGACNINTIKIVVSITCFPAAACYAQYWDKVSWTKIATGLNKDIWYDWQIQWQENGIYMDWRYNFDNAGWGDWIRTPNADNYLDRIVIEAPFSYTTDYSRFYIDDFLGDTIFEGTTTDYLSIQPDYPVDCQFNYNANSTSTATGYIYNPTSTAQTFYYITASLTDTLTGYAHIASSTALVEGLYDEPIHAGDWATYDFDFAIGTSTYYIDYYLEGDIFTFAPQHCYTTIGTATSTARPPIINEPIYTAQEDCSLTTSTTDRLLCEIKNFFTGLFFPSGEKVIELQNNLKELNNRFPISYINVWTTFATNLNHETTDIVLITFFEATSSVDFTGMDTTIDYGNQSTGFMERLRNIFGAILIFGFFLWGITFLKRVFK
jgi:hypothetical protein